MSIRITDVGFPTPPRLSSHLKVLDLSSHEQQYSLSFLPDTLPLGPDDETRRVVEGVGQGACTLETFGVGAELGEQIGIFESSPFERNRATPLPETY